MRIVANVADRLLAAIVPHAKAAAWSCPGGSHRVTCGCYATSNGTFHWFDKCIDNTTGQPTQGCTQTVYLC